jgi:hypothetical protein
MRSNYQYQKQTQECKRDNYASATFLSRITSTFHVFHDSLRRRAIFVSSFVSLAI